MTEGKTVTEGAAEERERRRQARHRILQFLAGQLEAAVENEEFGAWLRRDHKGDRLTEDEAKSSVAEAKSLCEELGTMVTVRVELLV